MYIHVYIYMYVIYICTYVQISYIYIATIKTLYMGYGCQSYNANVGMGEL